MQYLFINSMSRTGTSLLYQLLYGCEAIYFAPYRIKFVCNQPFGFPLTQFDSVDFFKTLMEKTTIVDKKGKWPEITTNTLINLFPHKTVENLVIGQDSLDTAVRTIHKVLEIDYPTSYSYYCLHDDHSYMLGSQVFKSYKGKILTTIRHPLDMIASKKNMLTMYVYGQKDPKQFTLKKEVINKEVLRSIFSWWCASYEYANHNALPLLYSFLKDLKTRREVMCNLVSYLGTPFSKVLLNEKNILDSSFYHNELLANGSSLSTIEYLSKGSKRQEISSFQLSLNDEELEYLLKFDMKLFDFSNLTEFLESMQRFYKEISQHETLRRWCDLYMQGRMLELFEEYSAYNYGCVNANMAFEI